VKIKHPKMASERRTWYAASERCFGPHGGGVRIDAPAMTSSSITSPALQRAASS
jgi:hypothetical protein